jgi:hypothetical protein
MIAGGNNSLRLDAYSHLLGGEIEFTAFCKNNVRKPQADIASANRCAKTRATF